MQTSDAELLLQYVNERSQSAFHELMERHSGMVFGICRRKLSDQQLAEDATQMVFMALASSSKELEPGPLDGYLAKTAIFISRDMARRRAVRTKHEHRMQEELRPVRSTAGSDDRLRAVQAVLEHLRDGYREAVMLRYIDGLSVESVAVALDISPQTAKKRLVRALAHLRQRMADLGFCISLSFVAGLLQKLREPPPPGLTAKIAKAVFSGSPQPTPRPRLRLPGPLGRIALGAAAGVTVTGIFGAVLMPRVQRPTTTVVSASRAAPAPPAVVRSLSIQQRLGRQMAGLNDRGATLADTLGELARISDIRIEARWDEIEAEGIKRDMRLQFDLPRMTAGEQLNGILRAAAPGKLEYVVSGDRVIVQPRPDVTSDDRAAAIDRN